MGAQDSFPDQPIDGSGSEGSIIASMRNLFRQIGTQTLFIGGYLEGAHLQVGANRIEG